MNLSKPGHPQARRVYQTVPDGALTGPEAALETTRTPRTVPARYSHGMAFTPPPRTPSALLRALLAALALGSVTGAHAQAHRTAVWLRPPEQPQELERTLVAARQAGFTDVLLEGFYHGRAIWTSSVAPMKLQYDALALASRVARREGLHLNVWFETLYWRPDRQFGIPVTPLWQDRYATLSEDGRTSLDVSRLGFVDPSDPDVGNLLAALTAELGRTYPDVGLHLDYLRYPREANFGYHPAAVQAFREQTGIDAGTLRGRDPNGEQMQDRHLWQAFRRDTVTALAGRLVRSYRDAGGQGLVSAAVFGRVDPLQDWRHWPGLEVAMPMLYYPFPALYRAVPLLFPPAANVWPGIRVGPGGAALAPQLDLLHGLGYPNVAVFGWTPDGTATPVTPDLDGTRP
ncbi:family 10 glycosylhydrolase [Deinococcus aquiradiocola]|uniref:Glycosyl hydrolase-like 10 domain-containing protein n=1 Tax=Deinococcus aquiradiocola TaxID=393059 RepID=A0A917UVY8_9DEIO|nr:family 10 glycosylhydrolase [Deinococcus aquiradiocola]GGJ88704.1 hypothetical protein GCM10008939_36000 [Deinococcus aquiradiocola]